MPPQVLTPDPLRATLVMVAPGTPLRAGLERILRARTGALIVLGEGPAVEPILSGGFQIGEDFTAQRLSELAKMDGAIVLSQDSSRIARANVHLVPDPQIPTAESGTRHRTAERVAKQTKVPVISVSQSMRIVTLYLDSTKYVLEEIAAIITRANNALQTLERYKQRLDEVSSTLTALEVEDLATLRDALNVVQRVEMVRRIAGEIEGLVTELGTEGRLLSLQLEELMGGVEPDRQLVMRDYLVPKRGRSFDTVLRDLEAVSAAELLDPLNLARILNCSATTEALEQTIQPKGYRLLSKIPRLPAQVIDRIVSKFGVLPKVIAASIEDLLGVEGVGAARAASIKDGLARLAESSILERYL
ncbi:MAG: DNA integrity scanning protein DisA [Acidobacteria bacterium]|nr:DNA integrity scanning protein DisA [Acidobacteriota bacterium]